jgi:hypothetical protein
MLDFVFQVVLVLLPVMILSGGSNEAPEIAASFLD